MFVDVVVVVAVAACCSSYIRDCCSELPAERVQADLCFMNS